VFLRHYEQVFILKPTLTPEENSAKVENIKEAIEKNGGEILAYKELGMRELAYEIDKNKRGFYGVIYFKTNPSAIKELERLLKLSEDVLKYLTIKYDSKKEVSAFNGMVDATNGKKPEVEEKEEETPVETPSEEKQGE
jgi:small subunit ribosomal protein S6